MCSDFLSAHLLYTSFHFLSSDTDRAGGAFDFLSSLFGLVCLLDCPQATSFIVRVHGALVDWREKKCAADHRIGINRRENCDRNFVEELLE